jgi:hypothetical protein
MKNLEIQNMQEELEEIEEVQDRGVALVNIINNLQAEIHEL